MLNPDYILHICADKDSLDQACAAYWLEQAREAITQRGVFHVALTGGATPQALYRLLASPHYAQQIDWSGVHIYIGDERYVPHDHTDSNFGMTRVCLLDHVAIPAAILHPIPTDEQQATEAARRYAVELQQNISVNAAGFPQLDLIMLGMGDDGHTASLFPGTDILIVADRSVAATYVDKLAAWRVSMTYPTLNAARQIMLMVSGDNKSAILAHVLTKDSTHVYPIQGVHNDGEFHCFIDQAAAGGLA